MQSLAQCFEGEFRRQMPACRPAPLRSRLSDLRDWLASCVENSMQITTGYARKRLERISGFEMPLRGWARLGLLLFIGGHMIAGNIRTLPQESRPTAFARYVTTVQAGDPFTESGPVAVFIEASLPQLYKSAELLAIRQANESERSEYRVVSFEGDGTVAEEVIDRYVGLYQVLQQLPMSSVAVTPANYKFRFRGDVKTGGRTAYMYDISPKKNRVGLVKGQIWIDADTGAEVFLTGRLTVPHSIRGGVINVVRETTLPDHSGLTRTTHLVFAIPQLGRGELAVIECPLQSGQAVDELSLRHRL
jgi:hypothetical protein